MSKKLLKVPIITLSNVVFFPNTSLPLYIVDQVFEKLIKDSIREGTMVGIALANPSYSESSFSSPFSICGIGTPMLLERSEDGVLKVLMKGCGKVLLKDIYQHIPYPIYYAEYYKDITEPCNLINSSITRLRNILHEWLNQNISNPNERSQFLETIKTDQHAVDYVATFLVKDYEIRQLLLENNSFVERVKLLNAILSQDSPFKEDKNICSIIKDFNSIEKLAKYAH